MAVLSGWVICLVNSDNERDLNLLNSTHRLRTVCRLLRGLSGFTAWRLSNNRSVMPLDVLGCTRYTEAFNECITCFVRTG